MRCMAHCSKVTKDLLILVVLSWIVVLCVWMFSNLYKQVFGTWLSGSHLAQGFRTFSALLATRSRLASECRMA